MADEITNSMLLEHIQAMKYELQHQIADVNTGLQKQITVLQKDVHQIKEDMTQGFDDAKKDRQALHEDLEETMRVQGAHAEKLAHV